MCCFRLGDKVIFDLNNVSGSQMRVATGVEKFEQYKAKLALCGRANVFNLEQHERTLSPFYREVRLALGLKPKEIMPAQGQGGMLGQNQGQNMSTETVPETNYASSKETGGQSNGNDLRGGNGDGSADNR